MRLTTIATAILILASSPAFALSPDGKCLKASGKAGAKCLNKYAVKVEKCRKKADQACEDDLRAEGGVLEEIVATPIDAIDKKCVEENMQPLGYFDLDDMHELVPQGCVDWGEDWLDAAFADDVGSLSPDALKCQKKVAPALRVLMKKIVGEFGKKCFVDAFEGKGCDRSKRDTKAAAARKKAREKILKLCGAEFDSLGLVASTAAATLEERIDLVLDTVVNRAQHFALQVYPPNDLGPTSEFGPYPVGVKTLNLEDPSRLNYNETANRPVTVEVYYPSTEEAVEGVPRDTVFLFGVPVTETPAYRDVALAAGTSAGTFPLVFFSHGNNGIRFQSFFFTAHLASHGYVVVTPDHHGNTFVDELFGIIDPDAATNRPLDISFLIDTFIDFDTDPGFFQGALDTDAIGVSGHSFGGYTTFALAGGTFSLGTFTDARVKAIFPQAPSASAFEDSFFSTIAIPTLIVGGSIDETTPFDSQQQRPFDLLPAGASVDGLANLIDAGHFTFSDFCEVPRALLAFLGGFEEACEPRHLPWRHAHDIVNYLSLNFFDGVLKGDVTALERLDPANLATIEELVYQSK